MYKNLISKIVAGKVAADAQKQKQEINQRRIENIKYNSGSLMLGYVSKIIVYSNGKESHMVAHTPKVFVRVKENILQDIETGKLYPLVLTGQQPQQDLLCVLERDIEPFVSTCIEVFDEKGIDYDSTLTSNQAKSILNRQSKLNELRY